MELTLKNKTIVVTGSAGLIGTRLCQDLATSGANVVLVDVSPRNDLLRGELAKLQPSGSFVAVTLDVAQEDTAHAVADVVDNQFGGTLHGLVNAVQYKSRTFFHDIQDTSLSELQDIFAANVFSIFWMVKHLTGALRKANGASIVNLSSTYAIVSPNPELYAGTSLGCPPTYVATKGAVHSITKYLACYLAKHKIRVNSLTPHGVFNNHEPTFMENFGALSPSGRMSTADEVSPAILLLLSDQGSYINGANLKVDGGWTAW
jgi:NAD(P)-dependent dehydrogenase (short-subunit alcohol dehydrogenase family)